MCSEIMQENRHTFNMISQIIPNVNNLEGPKKTILQEFYGILQIVYKKFNFAFDTPERAPAQTKV